MTARHAVGYVQTSDTSTPIVVLNHRKIFFQRVQDKCYKAPSGTGRGTFPNLESTLDAGTESATR